MLKKVLLTAAVILAVGSVAHAQDTVVYDNLGDFSGYLADDPFAGATAANPYTVVVADDINVLSGYAGGSVTSFTVTMSNENTGGTSDDVTPVFSFYAADGANGGPGTLLASLTGNAQTLDEGYIYAPTFTPNGDSAFTIPQNGLFWAGVSFTAATSGIANNIAQGVFTPGTVGSSTSNFFVATNPGAGTTSNPAGSIYHFTSGDYSFGWNFTATAAPEPSQYAAFGLGILGLGGLALKARRRSATV